MGRAHPATPHGPDGLTERQFAALACIDRSLRERGYPPTMREIGAALGIHSTNGVNDHLRALERKGHLIRSDFEARGLRITEAGTAAIVARAGAPLSRVETVDPAVASVTVSAWLAKATPEQAAAIVSHAREVLGLRLAKSTEAA